MISLFRSHSVDENMTAHHFDVKAGATRQGKIFQHMKEIGRLKM